MCDNVVNVYAKVSVIVIDIKILFEKLKENKDFNTPVIPLPADAIASSKEKYLSEGFVDYIAKTFSRDQIIEKLDKIFNK